MPLWFAGFLGLVQGLTEFLPVSSTAHLRIAPTLVGQPDAGAAYTAVIQLGTLAAVIVYFAKDLIGFAGTIVHRDFTSPEGRLPWLIVIGTLPIVVAGLLLKKHIESDLRSLYIIAVALVGVGIVMAIIDQVSGKGDRTLATIGIRDAVIVGLAQTLALVPGVSRSGATICMALLLGFTRSDSARFSFLLSIPAVAGAGILEARSAFATLGSSAIAPIAVGIATAFVVGYASIAWFLKWLGSHQLLPFAIYRVLAGLALIAALVTKLID